MASYTKRMIAAAAAWLKANPDPTAVAIQTPPDEAYAAHEAEVAARVARAHARAEHLAHPEINAKLAALDKVIAEHHAESASLRAAEDKLQTLLNGPLDPCRLKLDVDTGDKVLGAWYLAWARQAYNVFELAPDFTAAMLLTDATTIDITTLRLPFDGILMLIPPGFAVGAEGAHYTKIHLWVRADTTAARLHSYATDGCRGIYAALDLNALSWDAVETVPGNVVDATDQHAQHTLTRITLGAVAYLTAVDDAAIRRPAQAPRRTGRIDAGPVAACWDVGRSVRLAPALVQAARAGSRETAFQIKHRFIVRGHYRNQPTGPRRSERTRIWIAPFWKGPEEGARIAHVYKLDEAP